MSTFIWVAVLLGGCFLMHFLMMRKGGHSGDHGNMGDKDNEEYKKDDKTHGGHGCCH